VRYKLWPATLRQARPPAKTWINPGLGRGLGSPGKASDTGREPFPSVQQPSGGILDT